MDRQELAAQYFMEGYNCAQAVIMAYADTLKLEPGFCAKISSSFGGGMGRMREVCGAVSGMLMVAGLLYGYDGPEEGEVKKAHYACVQALAEEFRNSNGSIICREILKNPPSDPTPTPRTKSFYEQRPCVRMVMEAVRIMDEYLETHPVN